MIHSGQRGRAGHSQHAHHDSKTPLRGESLWATDANIASTAAIIHGEAAPAWLAGLGLAARLVAESGAVLTLGGWPPEPPAQPGAL